MGNNRTTPGRLAGDIETDVDTLLRYGADFPELIVKRYGQGRNAVAIAYLASVTNNTAIHEQILAPLLNQADPLQAGFPFVSRAKRAENWPAVVDGWCGGYLVLLRNGSDSAELYDVKKYPLRQPEEPSGETVIKGNHIGFVESLEDNLAMIRYFLQDGRLVCRTFPLGERAKTTCALLYLKDLTNEEWISEMTRRIESIHTDAVTNIGILEEWLEDTNFSIFPQLITTERPDAAVSHLLHGRVAVLLDKTAGAVIGPVSFHTFFQSLDDYVIRWPVGSFLRMLRMAAFLIAVFLPSVYIAALTYHYEIIPIDLMISIGRSREKVPLPPILEAFIMEIVLEMLREAGLRLPSKVGQTVGIVGGIVIGQAAVQAGIVSNIMVVVVSFTAVASFIQPQQDMAAAIRLLRFPFMFAAYLFGAVGIVCGMLMLAAHVVAIQSLRVPFGSPFAPIHTSEWRDAWVRAPRWMLWKRPVSLRPLDEVRHFVPPRFRLGKRKGGR